MDETGFRIGVGRAYKVVTIIANKDLPLFLQDPDNRELITSIECICARGSYIPSFIILSAKTLTEKTFIDELPGDYKITVSDSGYTNDTLHLN